MFADRVTPGQWRAEWFGDDGRCELQIFTGPTARREALRYAMQNYTHFKEVQLEPYPPDLPDDELKSGGQVVGTQDAAV